MDRHGVLLIGKVVGAHGLMGALRVDSYAESPSIFQSDNRIILQTVDGRNETYPVRWVKPHKKGILLSLKGIDDRNRAESLIGSQLFVDKAPLPEPEDGAYYWDDLIGLSVYTPEGEYLGRVVSILPTGSNDVYVVKDQTREILVPALASVVREIFLEEKRMTVDLPEGLLDL